MRARSACDMPGDSANCASGPPGARCSTAKAITETSHSSSRFCSERLSRYRVIRASQLAPGLCRAPHAGTEAWVSSLPVPCTDVPAARLDVDVGLEADEPFLGALDHRVLEDRQ